CLLRPTSLQGEAAVEVYHDRIGEAVLASLSADDLRARHGKLADAFQIQPVPEPEALFRHCLGAGRREEAADWAVQAADRAANALACGRAADLYRQALALQPRVNERTAAIETQLANALVSAGRGASAGPVYVAAATKTTGMDGLELRRRAAEQYL